jgi:RHS repeat-associated protein
VETIGRCLPPESGKFCTLFSSYTSGNGLTPQYLVKFNYIGGRTDDPLQFTAGVLSQTALQLNTIQVQQLVSGSYSTISTYALTYSTGITGRLRLATITRTGASGGTVLPLSFSYCDQCNAPADLLTNFYNGLDGSPASGSNPASGGTQITYLLTTHSSVYPTTFNAAVQYPSQNLVKPRYVVQTVQAPDETGSNYTPGTYNLTYTYFNGLQNLVGRGFLGFGSVCAFDSQTTLQKCTSYNQQFPNIGNVMETKVSYCPNKDVACTGAVVQQDTQTTFGTFTPYNGRPAANTSIVTNVVTTGADLNGNPLPTTTKYCGTPTNSTCVTDGYGNELVETTTIQSDVEGGWVNSTYTTVANYTFANDLASWAVEPSGTTPLNWLVGKLTQSSVTGSYTNSKVSPPVTTTTSARVTQYSYTPVAPLAPVQTGFLSQETVQPTSGGGCQTGFTAVTNYTPDVYGHVAQEVVSAPCDSTPAGALASRTTQWSYSDASDPNHVFPHQITNALNQVEKREYDMRWGLESTVTDINNQTTTYTYDDLGRRTKEVPNDSSTITTSYIGCTGSPAATVTATSMACPAGGQYAIQTTHIGADNATTISPRTMVYYDILDRQVADDTLAFDGVNLSRVAKTYNSQLQVASTTRPYFAGPNTIQTPAITTYQYDQLNRVIRTNYPDSSWDTISFYETVQNITRGITANSSGEETYKYYDGAGKLVVSQQNSATLGGTAWIYTNYLYDGFGDLTQVTDNAGNITTYDYDVLGRKDGYTDPDAGGFLQNYNAFGEAYGGGNGFDSFDSIRYDQLGRMVWRCWTNPANATAAQDEYTCANATVGNANEILETWTYDPAQGIGELGQEYSTQGTSTTIADTYNALGQPNTSSYTIGNGTGALNYSYSYSYDAVHRPSYYVSPNGTTTPLTTYNSTGYIASLSHKGGNTVWTAVTRDAEMHLTEASYGNGTGNGNGTGAGNGMASAYSYDPNRGYETQFVTTYTPPAGGTPVTVQNLAYSWDQHGNMVGRADTVNSLSEAYCYDGLNRLGDVQSGSTTCSFGGNTTTQLNYTTTSGSSPVTTADIGNIIYKSDIGNYTYPATGQPQPHGVQTITNPSTGATLYTITYDSVGKVLKDGLSGTTLTYTPFQMPLKVKAASGASYTVQYDADHHRIMRTAGSADLAIYLPDSDLSVNTSTSKTIWNTYFMAGGQRVGSDTGAQTSSGITLTTEYFENDYQNSISLVTADNFSGANPKVNQGFDAFGHPRSVTGTDTTPWPTTTPPRGYINQVMLPAEEIVDLNARYYDPALGRFLAPDPMISDMDDSQAWNAYSYSDNNPMSKEDSTGLGCSGSSGSSGSDGSSTSGCSSGGSSSATPQAGGTPRQSEDIKVQGQKPHGDGMMSAHAASATSKHPGGSHVPSGLARLAGRAAVHGRGSAAARTFIEYGGYVNEITGPDGGGMNIATIAGSLAVLANGEHTLSLNPNAGGWPDDALIMFGLHMADFLGMDLRITGGLEPVPPHIPGSVHPSGDAFDLGFGSNPGLLGKRTMIEVGFNIFSKTGWEMQFEFKPGHTPAHYHFQDVPLHNNFSGILPGNYYRGFWVAP